MALQRWWAVGAGLIGPVNTIHQPALETAWNAWGVNGTETEADPKTWAVSQPVGSAIVLTLCG